MELTEISNQHEAVLVEIAEALRFSGQGFERVRRGLDLDRATLGILEQRRLSIAPTLPWLRKEAPSGIPAPWLRSCVEKRTLGLRVFPAALNRRSIGG
jgi:hypothetical protein